MATKAKQTGTSVVSKSGGAIAIPKGFKQVKSVVLPLRVIQADQPISVVFVGPMVQGMNFDEEGKPKRKPMTVAECGDVETGEHFRLCVPTVVESNLKSTYPNESYVGQVFYLEQLPKPAGKRYFNYNVVELERE